MNLYFFVLMQFFYTTFVKKEKNTCYFVFISQNFFIFATEKKQKLKYYGNNQYNLERCAPL